MPSLSIRIDLPPDGSSTPTGLVAELACLEPRVEAGRLTRKVSVTTGRNGLVELAPGRWEVRVVTATGRLLSQEVVVGAEPVVEARFALPSSAVGTPARRDVRGRDRSVKPPTIRLTRGMKSAGYVTFNDAADIPFAGGNRGFSAEAAAGVDLYIAPYEPTRSDERIRGYWAQISDALSRAAVPRFLWVGARQARGAAELGGGLAMDGAPGGRAWALLAREGTRRLHVVPTPWRMDRATTEVMLVIGSDPADSRMMVRDPAYAGLLDYLAKGSLAAAADLLHADDELAPYGRNGATELLRDKGASPLGACAAAYALLGSSVPGEDARWHDWIANLSRQFEWLPDGAVLLARLLLMQARNDAEIQAALPVVMEAAGRGLPYYRQGFDWLLQAMLQFEDEPGMRALMTLVRDAAAALDMTQVFTTLML